MRRIVIIVSIIVIEFASAFGVYVWRTKDIAALRDQQAALKRKVSELQGQYASVKAASNVSTAGWKKFCDQFAPFCLSYPGQWTVSDNSLRSSGDNREYASITSPSKMLYISYVNPLIKDGGSLSVRVIKTTHITVGGVQLAVLGIIPVSSGEYEPSYILLGTAQALNIQPSDKPVLLEGSINARFSVGKHDAIYLTGYSTSKKITSYAQAKAWFDSVDGKTVAGIIESFSTR